MTEIKTLTDVIKFVNEYWAVLQYYRLFNPNITVEYIQDPDNTLTSTGDYE